MTPRALRLCIATLLAVPRLCAGLSVGDIVSKVQERYDATKDFTADVTQEVTVASLGKTITARGTISFKRPGKMRLELSGDDEQIIVADGTTLWLYQPKEKQVLKAPFDSAFRSSSPISFLTGVGRIADDFDVSLDGESADGHDLYLLLQPRHDGASVGRLRLTVARKTFDIHGAEVHDPAGNVSRLQFDRIRRNIDLTDDQFVFQVPPGVDVISAPLGQ